MMNPEDACTYHVGPYLLVTFLIKATMFSKNTLENEYEDKGHGIWKRGTPTSSTTCEILMVHDLDAIHSSAQPCWINAYFMVA
jgi:hypothetical protein